VTSTPTAKSAGSKMLHPLARAAYRCGISTDTLRRACKDGRVKYIRIGNRIMIPSDILERILREGL
jgi:hypothetical protein